MVFKAVDMSKFSFNALHGAINVLAELLRVLVHLSLDLIQVLQLFIESLLVLSHQNLVLGSKQPDRLSLT